MPLEVTAILFRRLAYLCVEGGGLTVKISIGPHKSLVKWHHSKKVCQSLLRLLAPCNRPCEIHLVIKFLTCIINPQPTSTVSLWTRGNFVQRSDTYDKERKDGGHHSFKRTSAARWLKKIQSDDWHPSWNFPTHLTKCHGWHCLRKTWLQEAACNMGVDSRTFTKSCFGCMWISSALWNLHPKGRPESQQWHHAYSQSVKKF